MFRALAKLFHKPAIRTEPFVDVVLGEFEFLDDLGWKTRISLGGETVELVLGADGEPPSDEMMGTAKSWVEQWPSQHPKIVAYIEGELVDWSDEPGIPVPDSLKVESIQILWRDNPRTSMVYFRYPGDDLRSWHVTFDGFEPDGFAYDD